MKKKKNGNDELEEYMRRMFETMFNNMHGTLGQPTFYSFSFTFDEDGNAIPMNNQNEPFFTPEYNNYRRIESFAHNQPKPGGIQPAPKADVIETADEFNITMEVGEGDIQESVTIYPTENGLFITCALWRKSLNLPCKIDINSVESTILNNTLDITAKKLKEIEGEIK